MTDMLNPPEYGNKQTTSLKVATGNSIAFND